VGASLLAIDVNDNAPRLDERGAWKSIVGTPPGAGSLPQWDRRHTCNQVGDKAASLLLLLLLLIFLPLAAGGVPFFQVTRCKSGTLGGRYRRNGYTPNPNPPRPNLK